MIETIGPRRPQRRPRDDALRPAPRSRSARWSAACFTFGALASLGALLHGADHGAAYVAAAAIALVAAVAELRGVADPAAAPPPAPRALAPGDADAGRRRPLRRPARARVHHLRAHLRRLRPGRDRRSPSAIPRSGSCVGLALRHRPRAADRARRADRRPRRRGSRSPRRWPSGPAIYRGLRARRRARAARRGGGARRRRAGGRRPHRRPARPPIRRSAARTSSSSVPTGPAVLRRGGRRVALPGPRPGARRRADRGDRRPARSRSSRRRT